MLSAILEQKEHGTDIVELVFLSSSERAATAIDDGCGSVVVAGRRWLMVTAVFVWCGAHFSKS